VIERDVAEWAASFRPDDGPRELVELMYLDALASGAAGLTQDLVRDIRPVATEFGGHDGAARATFLAAYAITSATACDVYRPGMCHVTPVVVPPLLALSARRDDDFFAALTIGLELTTRLCIALNYPALRARGWHTPGVAGTVGAAAATARLLGLDADATRNAMAFAALQAAGTWAALGTEAVKFNQARGAVAGLLAALTARAGLHASDAWLTAPDGGLAPTYTEDADPSALTDDLGTRWELERISLRRWPAASSVQSLIDVCRGLDEVDTLRIELAPAAYQVSGDRPWRTPLEAMQSARWVAACVLSDGTWWLEHSSTRLADSALDARARRFDVVANAALGPSAVRLEGTHTDGTQFIEERDHAPGDPEQPLTREQVDEKLEQAAASAGLAVVDIADALVGAGVPA
jgi:2-methylcitrate dehydratase PrpD